MSIPRVQASMELFLKWINLKTLYRSVLIFKKETANYQSIQIYYARNFDNKKLRKSSTKMI